MLSKYFGNLPPTQALDYAPIEIQEDTNLTGVAYSHTYILDEADYEVFLPASNDASAGGGVSFVSDHSYKHIPITCLGLDTILLSGIHTDSIIVAPGTSVTLEDAGGGTFVATYSIPSAFGIKPSTFAPKHSPVLTGTPEVPVLSDGDNDNSISNTEYAISALVSAGFLHKENIPDITDLSGMPIIDGGFIYNLVEGGYTFQLSQHPESNSLLYSFGPTWTEIPPLDSPIFTGIPKSTLPTDDSEPEQVSTVEYIELTISKDLTRAARFDSDGEWISPITGTVYLTGAGAGGGGRGVISDSNYYTLNRTFVLSGPGGGGGAVADQIPVDVVKGVSYNIKIGLGGTGGQDAPGRPSGMNGGDTLFGDILILKGGEGGGGGVTSWPTLSEWVSVTTCAEGFYLNHSGRGGEGILNGVNDDTLTGQSGGTYSLGSDLWWGGRGGGSYGGRGAFIHVDESNEVIVFAAEAGGLGSGGGGGCAERYTGQPVVSSSGGKGGNGFLVIEW